MTIFNLLNAFPRRAFWLGVVFVCLTSLVLLPLVRTRAAYQPANSPRGNAAQEPESKKVDVGKIEAADMQTAAEPPASSDSGLFGMARDIPQAPVANRPEASRILAPLSGTKNIPGDYADLNAAITDLNTQGVAAPGVTFNVLAGNPQSAPAGGYVIGGTGSLVLTSSSAAAPIVFTGNSNTVTAFSTQTSSALNDAVFKLIGADFVTIQNFTIQENPANTVTAAATNTMTEFGVALFYVTTTDGAKNNTIQNNTITLNRAYQNTFGIYSNTRASSTAVTGSAEVTSAGGSNSNNKIYGNNISNVDYGVVFVGAGTTIAAIDSGNDFGGGSAATGNTITNWGYNGTAISAYTSVTGSNFAMYLNQQINDNASFNTITSAAGLSVAAVQHGGIVKAYSVASPTAGTVTTTNLNSNTVTLNAAATTAQFTGLSAQGMSANSAATINMNNNLITGAISGAATTSTFLGLFGTSAPGTFNINGNTVRGVTSTASTTGGFVGIQQQTNAVGTALNINNNKIGDTVAGAVTFSAATSGGVSAVTVTSTGAASTSAVTITGNDIRGIVHSVAASSAHAYISNAAASLSQNISTNTFTNLNVNTTGNVTFISDSVSLSSTGTKNINGNSIVTAYNKGGAGGTIAFYGDGASSVTGSVVNNNNNNFSNVTFTGATTFNGWLNQDGLSATSGPTKTVNGNTFSNISGGSGAILVLTSSFGGGASNITSGNTINNITGTGAITGLSIGSTSNVNNVSLNTISTLSTTGAAAVVAFSVAGGTTTNAFRNKIYDIQANNASGTVNGLAISAGTTVTAYNNLIGDLRTPVANAANPLIGINIITGPTSVNVYYNTVYLNGASTGALFGSSAIFASTTPTVTLRNNIFANNSAVTGAGLAAAYRRSSTTLSTYAAASNNNDFFGSTIFTDGTNTFTAIGPYKTFVSPRDSASFSENPPFLSTTGSSVDFLHINPTVPTQIESGATPIGGITDDFDGQPRSGSNPDVGADEFSGIAIDLTGPAITYTNLANTGLTTNRVLSVTITDATGVNQTTGPGGFAPRIYFKRSGDASYVSTQCVVTGGTATNGTYDCTIDYSLLTPPSVAVADIIQYFVVAQDTAAAVNLGSNPTGATGANVNSVTFSGTPNQYTIIPAISGNKTVGVGGDYATLTAAVAALNAAQITGPVTLSLTDSSYTTPAETFPLTINANSGSTSTNTVTIKPAAGVTPAITGSSSSCIINLNGADWITIDGSNAVGGTSRDLTFTNTNSGSSSAVVCIESTGVGTGATNNTVKNTNVVGATTTATAATLVGIFSGNSTISNASAGADNDNNTIQNNRITKVTYGIYSGGASAANKNTGTVITQNVMNAPSPNNITTGGVLANFEDGIQISRNDMSILKHDGTTGTTNTAFGIALGVVPNNTVTTFTGSDVTNAQVTRNRINGVTQLNTTGYSTFGIVVNSVTSGTTLLANNMVSGVISPSTASDFSAGILAGGGTGSTTQIYHNSVAMSGARGTGTGFPSYALAINSGNPVVDVKNNIFYNTQTGGTGKVYAIANASTPLLTNMTSNYNDLYVTGATGFVGQVGGLGTAGADRLTLADWQAATGGDGNSISADPLFTSATDLHLPASPISPAIGAGTPIGTVTVDFDGDPRPASNPDIGADELVQASGGVVPGGTFYNASFGSGGPDTLAGDVTVTNSLRLTGLVDTGAFTLTIDCGAVVTSAGGGNYIIGNVKKNFCGAGTFTFPVGTFPNGSARPGSPEGTVAEYSPMVATISVGTFPSSLTVKANDTYMPGTGTSGSLSRHWDVNEIGDLTADMTFQYLDEDVHGNEAGYLVLKFEGSISTPPGSVNAALNQFTATGVTNFSKWGAGLVPTAAGASIGGRIVDANGRPIVNARVVLSGGNLAQPVLVQTGPFGYYSFEGLATGRIYVVTVMSGRHTFGEPSRAFDLSSDIVNADFISEQ